MVRVQLLGPVEAYAGDRRIELGGAKPRALFAALVLARGRVVPAERLIDVIWPQDPPDRARSLLQTYVSTLRASFGAQGIGGIIETRSPGYVAALEDVEVDVDVFARLLDEARARMAAAEPAAAGELLEQAIGLWRGAALSGLDQSPLTGEARALDELLTTAIEERGDVALRLGRSGLVAELTGLVARHPLNERLRGQLMTALYRVGRQADALACYRQGRDVLVEELGLEPGQELAAIHNAILRGDEDLRVAAVEPERPAPRVVPAQVPAAPADFTGRQAVGAASGRAFGGAAPGVVLLSGPGGSGKSALAAHAAEGLAAAFPDGRLYAELRGTSDSPATADRVLGGFLRSLGVDDGRLPASTQDRAELFRSLLADRRVLVVLDDAADEAQVRPLLPGGSGSGALVTSRYRLAGLAGAALIELDVLSDEQAWELLTHIVGAPRLAADPAAASRILALCENLPLAIRIAGARLAMRQRLPVRLLADRLADEWQRLDELSAGDLAVRASIELSYRALAPDAQAALRRMGFLGLPDCAPWIVGLLLGVPMTRAETLLESLVDAQLVTFAGVDRLGILRYRMHDLVRLFASERARAEDPAEELTDAVAAVTYGWFALAEDITASSPPAETVWRAERPDPVAVDDEVVKAVLADPSAWLQDEESRIAVGVEKAAGLGLHHPVSELVRGVIAAERYGAGRFEFRTRIIEAALAASQRARHGRGEALMLAELAQLRYAQDRFDEARRHFADVLERFRDLGDLRGQAVALTGLGVCCREPGLLTEAIAHLDQAAALAVTFGDDGGIGYVHRLRGSVLLEQGEYAAARADLDRSLAAYRTIGSRRGVALTLRTLGMYHRARGEYGPALAACAESASIFQECDDELMHSYAVRAHAKVQVRMGRAGEALPRLEQALAVTRAYGDRWGQACNLHVLGQLHLSEDRPGLAASCLGAAMSLWDELAAPLWRARTLHVVSLLHTRQGEHASAQTVLAQALAVFRQRGSREYKEIKDYLKVH